MDFDAIEALVTERIGLVIRDKDRQNFQQNIGARLKTRGVTDKEYLDFLRGAGAAAQEEWDKLHFALTVGESYFFRDRGQIDLIRDVVFPALIRENQAARKMRIWSAGCSTGEEPYSLAMLLDNLLPDLAEWDIRILATDLNRFALEKARLGLYPEWSFRKMEPVWRDRYFVRSKFEWQLDRKIRKMVEFRTGNLAADPLPDSSAGLADLDFIFCRNVFIYFSRETVEWIAERMSRALRPGGYFMSGHGELFNLKLPELRVEMHPNSVIYRRLDGPAPARVPVRPPAAAASVAPAPPPAPEPPTSSPPSPPAPPARPPSRPAPALMGRETSKVSAGSDISKDSPEDVQTDEYAQLEELMRAHRYEDLIRRTGQAAQMPIDNPALYLVARAYANLGDHASALVACERALEGGIARASEVLLLKARIIEESGHPEQALELLRRALYLDPDNVPAYLEMAEAYDRIGQPNRARKQRETALSLLKKLNSGTEIDRYEGITAGELTGDLETLLARNHE